MPVRTPTPLDVGVGPAQAGRVEDMVPGGCSGAWPWAGRGLCGTLTWREKELGFFRSLPGRGQVRVGLAEDGRGHLSER